MAFYDLPSAEISVCGKYRYTLTRHFALGPSVAWLMLNPSTADANIDDATIRKVIGFSERAGYGRITVINLFGIRETDSKLVRKAYATNQHFVEGPENQKHIEAVAAQSDAVVCAWGAFPWAKAQALRVMGWVDDAVPAGAKFFHIGRTKGGSPMHPLMAPYVYGSTNRYEREWLKAA